MAWRVMESLLVLRDQVNTLAPDRGKSADGTICDTNHSTTSDHCPHSVSGVGSEMVTALDLTHDPAHGFDSYKFAEVLRVNRDERIKYVISNSRTFDTSGSDAWTWRAYTGSSDMHKNHVHISVLDAPVSDTSTPWNLEGFMSFTEEEKSFLRAAPWQYQDANQPSSHGILLDKGGELRSGLRLLPGLATAQQVTDLAAEVATLQQMVQQLLNQSGGGGGATFPATSTFSTAGTIVWNPAPEA